MADNQKSALKPRNSTKPHTDSRDNKKRFSHHANTNKKTTAAQGSASRAAAALCVNAIEEGKSLTEALPLFTKELSKIFSCVCISTSMSFLRLSHLR